MCKGIRAFLLKYLPVIGIVQEAMLNYDGRYS